MAWHSKKSTVIKGIDLSGIYPLNFASNIQMSYNYAGLPSGLATCPAGFITYYIPMPIALTTTSVIQALLQIPDGTTQNWIVDSFPVLHNGQWYIQVDFSTNVGSSLATISWSVVAISCVKTVALTAFPVI